MRNTRHSFKKISQQTGHFMLPMIMTLIMIFGFILLFTPQLAMVHAVIFGKSDTANACCACFAEE